MSALITLINIKLKGPFPRSGMAVFQLLALAGFLACARGSGYGGGGFPPPMASYGAPVAPLVPQPQAYPIYEYDYDYDYYDDSFGGFFKGLSKGMSSLIGGGKGGGKGGGGGVKKPPKIVQIPVPQHVPPPPKPQVVHVKVPKCEPEVQYVTKYVNEKVPVRRSLACWSLFACFMVRYFLSIHRHCA